MRPYLTLSFFIFYCSIFAQDTSYAREVIRQLTSKKMFGRGYVKSGLQHAEKYLIKEIKKQNFQPLFKEEFTQSFNHPVNTFPKKIKVAINGKRLQPGVDYILNPSSNSVKGTYELQKVDSSHFIQTGKQSQVSVNFKKKLTYSVGATPINYCEINIDKSKFLEEPKEIKISVKNKLIKSFESKNIGCFIKGTSNSDSLIIFSAHYDHLGGMGSSTYFPGANDNASGVSVILNLIRYYKLHPPKYKTIFIFFAGEEAGLLGSKYFVEHSHIDLKKIKFLVNLDLLGTGADGIMVVNGAIHEEEFALLTKLNVEQNLLKEIKKRGKASNSDHYWFTEAGVPCFFIYTLGEIAAYHDVYDIEETLPLTEYVDVFKLITQFIDKI